MSASLAPVPADTLLITLQVTQIVVGIMTDSVKFRVAFVAAVISLDPTYITVVIVNVVEVNLRRRSLLAGGVVVVYNVTSTQPASLIQSLLSTGALAITAELQKTFPGVIVNNPTIVTFSPSSTTPSKGPSTADNINPNLTVVVGVVVGVGVPVFIGLVLFILYFIKKHHRRVIPTDTEQIGASYHISDDAVAECERET